MAKPINQRQQDLNLVHLVVTYRDPTSADPKKESIAQLKLFHSQKIQEFIGANLMK